MLGRGVPADGGIRFIIAIDVEIGTRSDINGTGVFRRVVGDGHTK